MTSYNRFTRSSIRRRAKSAVPHRRLPAPGLVVDAMVPEVREASRQARGDPLAGSVADAGGHAKRGVDPEVVAADGNADRRSSRATSRSLRSRS